MKLRQLQCVFAIVTNSYSVTAASNALFMSQPAVSKQIKLLEDELGSQIFKRNNKTFTGLTPFGDEIFVEIEKILSSVDSIKRFAGSVEEEYFQQLHIATTATLANYALVDLMPYMHKTYPQISFDVIESTNMQIFDALHNREADFGWFSAASLDPYLNKLQNLVYLPAMAWNLILIVSRDHELSIKAPDCLADIAKYPLITYVTSYKGLSTLAKAMLNEGGMPKVAITARSPDMIKNYVRSGMGVGAIANIAYDAEIDSDLLAFNLSLPSFQTYLVWNEEKRLRDVHYDFIEQIVPGANKEKVKNYLYSLKINKESEMWSI